MKLLIWFTETFRRFFRLLQAGLSVAAIGQCENKFHLWRSDMDYRFGVVNVRRKELERARTSWQQKKVYIKYNTFTETFNTFTETMPHFTVK